MSHSTSKFSLREPSCFATRAKKHALRSFWVSFLARLGAVGLRCGLVSVVGCAEVGEQCLGSVMTERAHLESKIYVYLRRAWCIGLG